MNPSKSLMALFVAMLIVAAPLARAADIVPVTAGPYTFYIDKDRLTALKPGAVEALFEDKAAAKKTDSTLTRKPDGSLEVNLYDAKMKMAHPTAAKAEADVKTTARTAAPQTKETAVPPKPASVKDDAIWKAVAGNPQVKPAQREATALAMQAFKSGHPQDYARLTAQGSEAAYASAITDAADKIAKKGSAADVDNLILSKAPKAATGDIQNANAQPVRGDDGEIVTVDDAVNRLIDLIPKDKALRDRIAQRLNEFIFDPNRTGDSGYVAQSVKDKDADTKVLTRLKTLAGIWVNGGPGNKPADPGAVARFYFVVGDNQDLPNGLANQFKALKSLKDSDDRKDLRPNLETRLKVFTNEKPAQGQDDNPGVDRPGQYAGQDEQGDQSALEGWWGGFFAEAPLMAKDVLDASKVTKIDVRKLVGQLDDPSNPPGVGDKNGKVIGGGKDANDILAKGFQFDDLYMKGAVTGWIPVPGQSGPGRHISIKIYSAREEGQMVDRVGIWDISEPGNDTTPSNLYGRRIALNKFGTSDIQLDDSRGDSVHYKVSINSNGSIKVLDADGKYGLKTDTDELYQLRRDQVSQGPLVEINKQKFFLSFQAAPMGTYTYYAADKDGKLKDEARLKPANIATATQIGSSGFVENKTDYRPLGNIGSDKDGKPVFYFLKWNDTVGNFEYRTCDEAKKDQSTVKCELPSWDVPPPPKEPKVTPGTTTPAVTPGTTTPAVTPGTTTPAVTPGTTSPATGPTTGGGDNSLNEENKGNGKGFNTSCEFSEGDFKKGEGFKKIDVGDWEFFLNRQDVSNAFHICINGQQTIFAQGVPLSKDVITQDADNLIVEVVNAGSFIPPDDILKGKTSGKEYLIPNKPSVKIGGRSVYYLPKSDLSSESLKLLAASGGNTAYIDKVAWVRIGKDPESLEGSEMEVHSRAPNSGALDGEAMAASVEKAFKLKEAGKSTFNNDVDRKKILEFVRTEFVRFKGKGTIATNPNVTVKLMVPKEITEIKAPIVTIFTNGDDTKRRLKNGDPDVRFFSHEYIVWCPENLNGKPRGLETYAQHEAHRQAAPK